MMNLKEMEDSWKAMRKDIDAIESKERELRIGHQNQRVDLGIVHNNEMDKLKSQQREEISIVDNERIDLCKKANI